MTYIFYDTETTGIDKTFDQILQFAAIRTDADLKELDRFDIRCRLLPHVIPSPVAMLTTRVTPAMLTDPGLPTHYEAMRRIAEKLREWSPAIFIGYNTLDFDESLLRQAFFQTLQPIYLTNTNGNQRGDVLRLAQVTATLAPNAITVPINDKNKPTLRLDTLAPANGFAHNNAHDALADVEATIFIAQHIRDRAPELWASLMPLVDKAEVTARMLSGRPFCLVGYHMGVSSVRPVVGCGQNPKNATKLAAFDLNKDPEPILGLDVDGLLAAMKGPDRAIRQVTANKMPSVVDLDLAPALETPKETILARAARIAEDHEFTTRVGQALEQYYPPRPAAEVVEARIYEGFPSQADEGRMATFHAARWEERNAIVEAIEDNRLRELGRRLIFLERPELLPPDTRMKLEEWLRNRQRGREGVVTGFTVSKALEELDKIDQENGEAIAASVAIRDWLESYDH